MEVHDFKEQPTLEETVQKIQLGNKQLHDYLLKSYQPFIAKVTSGVCKRYINPKADDEFSVALFAFNEALFLYAPEKGRSFLTFAKLVITRKVIDYIRYHSKRQKAISFDQFYDEETMENPAEVSAVLSEYRKEQDAITRREETQDYKEELLKFNLCLIELMKISPKHRDARDTAVRISRMLLEDEELKQYVLTKKKLPITRLMDSVNVSKKTLERNRKYILAIFIVLNGNYIYLQEYLKDVGC